MASNFIIYSLYSYISQKIKGLFKNTIVLKELSVWLQGKCRNNYCLIYVPAITS